MSETLVTALLTAAVLIGVGAAAYYVMRSPDFWVEVAKRTVIALTPILMKRMPPDKEQEWRDCIKRGGQWDPVKKKCKR